MKVPVNRLLKADLIWLGTHTCRHGHTYLEHYACFMKEKPDSPMIPEVIGSLDIEASNLHATFGYMFSYAIKTVNGKKLYGRVLRPNEISKGIFDKVLIKEFVEDTKKFDRFLVYWGKDRRYDVPFLRTRALRWKVDFPLYKDMFVTDVYDIVRNKLRLHRNRLADICRFLDIPAKAHNMIPDKWQRAMAGDKDALHFIWLHNKEDVISLEEVWKRVWEYVKLSKTSI